MALDPSAPETLLVGCEREGLFRSEDGAQTWTRSSRGLEPPVAYALAFAPSTPPTELA